MIFVECKPDYELIKLLITSLKVKIVHAGSKGEVCKAVLRHDRSIGIIDEDSGRA